MGSSAPATQLPGPYAYRSVLSVEPDGTVVYVWQRDGTFESERPPGGDFGPPTQIEGIPQFAEWTAATSRSGRILIVWGNGGAITGVERGPHDHFGPPFQLPIPGEFFNVQSASIADSGAAAVTAGYEKEYLVARDPGQSFRKAALLGRGSLNPLDAVVDDAGDVALAWFDDQRRVLASYRAAGGKPQKPRLISPRPPVAPRLSDSPGLAITSTGRATVAWEASDGATVRTVARDFSRGKTYAPRLVGALPTFVQEAPPEACTPPGQPLVLSTPEATIFTRDGRPYACLRARGVPVALAPEPEQSAGVSSSTAHAGALIAYPAYYLGHSTDNTSVKVTDLRDPFSGVNREVDPEGFDHSPTVLQIRLKSNGAVAWIDCPSAAGNCGRVGGAVKHVAALDSRALKMRRLDSGRRIDPTSFRLRGSTLTWRKRGKVRHATLR